MNISGDLETMHLLIQPKILFDFKNIMAFVSDELKSHKYLQREHARTNKHTVTHFEMPNAVISAGCVLSLRSKAVCIVSLLLNTSCRSHL